MEDPSQERSVLVADLLAAGDPVVAAAFVDLIPNSWIDDCRMLAGVRAYLCD